MPPQSNKLSRNATPGPNPANILIAVAAIIAALGAGYYFMNAHPHAPDTTREEAAAGRLIPSTNNAPLPTAKGGAAKTKDDNPFNSLRKLRSY